MPVLDVLFGKPLASMDARAERIGPAVGIPIFGLDALSSAAYGPEAALTLLIPLGAAGVATIVPVSFSIIALLLIVYFSYRQTIAAYPGGGGSYTVARQNIGPFAGLLAAAALMIDYVLTVAVGISAGVGALTSAAPSLLPHTLTMCLGILVVITIANLRGVRECGVLFMVPTYLFLGCLLVAILIGAVKVLAAGGHPIPVVAPPAPAAAVAVMSTWLVLQVFSSGCTAMTGVEAVSNGVKAFREPTAPNAQRTLTVIIGLLIVLLAGIALLVRSYGIAATTPGMPGYESVLSMLLGAIAGKGLFYYVSIGSILLVLALSANTAFADFPRLCRIIAQDGYLPRSFGSTGRRLVYSQGIYVLAVLSAGLLVLFGGVTDRLIPLYAVGAFLAFTLSQAGMVLHWRRHQPDAWHFTLVNGLGAVATGITVVVVLVAKFVEGAWVTVLLIPLMLAAMGAVRRHYHTVAVETASHTPLDLTNLDPPLVIIPVQTWNRITQKALRFAYTLSKDVRAVHVTSEEEADNVFCQNWHEYTTIPALAAGVPEPELVVIPSPYRWVLRPIIEYVLKAERDHPGRGIAVVVPELVERRWYHYMLHNQRAEVLKALLVARGSQRITVINVPWYLN
ncbi:MAG TPA: APC family permease [Bryobacteraceae bacterium]|nr:APC family permease [Bryobacteraceae bacterium]